MRREKIFIVDGYNVIHKVAEWSRLLDRLESARNALIRYCQECMAMRGDVDRFIVVFDGDSSVEGGYGQSGGGVHVVFSESGESADDRILKLLALAGKGANATVVTEDNYVKRGVRVEGGRAMTVRAFREMGKRSGGAGLDGGGMQGGVDTKTRLSPKQVKDLNKSLMSEWGLE